MKKPNILIVYTDQQRWDALGAAGNTEIQTPHLDRLAAEGLYCDHAFVQNPLCMPSRISFLSGQYPSTLGITHMGVPVPDTVPVLPKLIRPYGYTCANFGKLHFLPHANRDHSEPHPSYGFDQLEVSDEPGCYEDAYRAWIRRKDPRQLAASSPGLPQAAAAWRRVMGGADAIRHPERPSKRVREFAGDAGFTHTAFVAERTMSFIEENEGRPWLCIAGFYSPHSPWIAPRAYLERYDEAGLSLARHEMDPQWPADISEAELRQAKKGYYAMISEVDHWVGQLVQRLEDTGQREDTIIVFTSDHGEFLGEHGRYGKGAPGPDCVARVPLIIQGKGCLPGQVYSGLVEAVDVLPTLLEAVGVPVPPQLQGRSLYPLMTGGSVEDKACALMEHDGWKNIRTKDYRYVLGRDGSEQLYDLVHDPAEYTDLADDASYGKVLAELRLLMLRRMLEIEAPLPRAWAY
ncbi:sulfatase [Paenibacillus sp. 1P07SE]|uniref:sulfatase family protein n=1 Tax=Paenibacillus sp. 1P07SE TaxID=3132209 RepID=UPI0039A417B1